MNDLKGHHVTQVALGKAHASVITNKGEVYTFGVNSKGQCGRGPSPGQPANKESK